MKKHYNCPRCGFLSDRLCNMKTHLQRKYPCKDDLNCGLSVDVIMQTIASDDELTRLKAENARLISENARVLTENAKLSQELESLKQMMMSAKDE